MPDFRTHLNVCKKQGYPDGACISVNKWMDAPASMYPGCQHRNFRHSKKDCDYLANQALRRTGDFKKAKEMRDICNLHRLVDKKYSKGCGCAPLFEV